MLSSESARAEPASHGHSSPEGSSKTLAKEQHEGDKMDLGDMKSSKAESLEAGLRVEPQELEEVGTGDFGKVLKLGVEGGIGAENQEMIIKVQNTTNQGDESKSGGSVGLKMDLKESSSIFIKKEAEGLSSDSASDTTVNLKAVDSKTELDEPSSDAKADSKTESEQSNSDGEGKEPEWEDILGSGSLMKLTVVQGKPNSRPQRLENCKIKYQCTLEDGTLVEESDCFELQLGDCDVIQGLDLALGLMNVGDKCKLKLEPRLAYGSKGLEPLVPPEATVHYDVELLSVEPEDEVESLSVNERRIRGNKKRERGNWWYSRGENQLAIQCYRRALNYLDEVEGSKIPLDNEVEVSDMTLQQLLEDRINVSNNMAAAQLKLELYDAALQSLQTVLRCQPENVKALYRKAKVYKAKNDINAALKCLKKAEEVSPNNNDILKEIKTLQKKQSEKELARRMFNGLQTDKDKEKAKKSRSKLFMWTTVTASVAVGLAGLAAYRFKLL